MTVSSQDSTVTYQGNGVATEFAFTFSVPDASVIDVFVTNDVGIVRQLTPPEFTVVLSPLVGTNPTPPSGKVVYSVGGVPIPVGFSLTINRNVPAVQNTSIANQSIIYPPVIEQALDYLTMLTQNSNLNLDRSIKVPIGDPLPADLPPVDDRKNQQAFFDADGNLTAGLPPAGGAVISAAMQPVVAAATIDEARALMGLEPDPKQITDNYVLVSDDNGRLLSLEGNKFYLVTANDFTTYPTNFRVQVVNNDVRAKLANIFGYTEQFIIYPDQQVFISRGPNGWLITRPGRWRPLVPKQFFVDPALGSDSISVADGLATGVGAFATVLKATQVVENNVDGDFTFNLSNTFHNMPAGGLVLNKRLSGGSAYKLVGNVGTPANVNIVAAAGTNGITVADGAILEISGVTLSGGNGSNSLFANRNGVISIGNVIFGSNPSGHNVVLFSGAALNVDASYHIAAGASGAYHIAAYYNSQVTFGKTGGSTITVTLDGTVSFTSGYYGSQLNSTIVGITVVSYVGGAAVSTPKAQVHYNGICNVGGAAVPGDLPAAVSNGGFFF